MFFTSISEDFVQFVWKYSLYESRGLYTTCGQQVQVISPGEQNTIGGPDFFQAKIQLEDTLWIGNVEIHISNREWYQHKHHLDEAYNNVILHVVLDGKAEPVMLANQRQVPSLLIGERIFKETLESYTRLQQKVKRFIPCQDLIAPKDAFLFHHLYLNLAIERLERKVKEIETDMHWTQGDMDMSFLILLFRHFGSPVNKQPFEQLARSLEYKHIVKQRTSLNQLESFLFGMANLLHNQDEYAKQLNDTFSYTKNLYGLEVLVQTSAWKFSGNRPVSFPTLRLAQLAALLYINPRPLTYILQAQDVPQLRAAFVCEPSAYWKTHYAFGKEWKEKPIGLSAVFIDKLIVNVVVPFIFFYGQHTGQDNFKERAFQFLEEIKAEDNALIKKFKRYDFQAKTALDSQALIQLYTNYCAQKRCLSCKWGYQLLKRNLFRK